MKFELGDILTPVEELLGPPVAGNFFDAGLDSVVFLYFIPSSLAFRNNNKNILIFNLFYINYTYIHMYVRFPTTIYTFIDLCFY